MGRDKPPSPARGGEPLGRVELAKPVGAHVGDITLRAALVVAKRAVGGPRRGGEDPRGDVPGALAALASVWPRAPATPTADDSGEARSSASIR